MFRRLLASALLFVSLTACKQDAPAPDTATPPANAPAAEPAAAPAPTPAATESDAQAATPAPAPADAVPPTLDPNAPEPRLGTDYEVIENPQPTWGSNDGRIEIAEVFSYRCVHCAEFQPSVNAWTAQLPADVRWEYVPAAFGDTWDNFARAYFAADVLGATKRTHDAVFDVVFVKQEIKSGSLEEIADQYAKLGVDRAKFLDATKSFGVTAKLNRARQFGQRTGITATPTIIINGKYRVNATPDRSFKGMLQTVNFLLAKERAEAAAANAAPAPPATQP